MCRTTACLQLAMNPSTSPKPVLEAPFSMKRPFKFEPNPTPLIKTLMNDFDFEMLRSWT